MDIFRYYSLSPCLFLSLLSSFKILPTLKAAKTPFHISDFEWSCLQTLHFFHLYFNCFYLSCTMAIHRWRSALFQSNKMSCISFQPYRKTGFFDLPGKNIWTYTNQKKQAHGKRYQPQPLCAEEAFSLMRILFIQNSNWSKNKRNRFFAFQRNTCNVETRRDADTKTILLWYDSKFMHFNCN